MKNARSQQYLVDSHLPSSVRLASDCSCEIGENPLWHPFERKLYWCDILRGRLFHYDPETGTTRLLRDGSTDGTVIGGFTIEADGALLLFMGSGHIERWTETQCAVVHPARPDRFPTRFNDVIADSKGRVFCGTMSDGDHKGCLYRLDLDGSLTAVVKDVGCSNGLAFSNDGRRLFYTDSFARTIYVFDYDSESGSLGPQQVFLTSNEESGIPDGLTIDTEDHLWSAQWDGACILRYSPSGRKVARIAVPAAKVASLTFAGDNLDTLFITTAGGNVRSLDGEYAGSLFLMEPGVRGVPEFRSRIYKISTIK
jgi:D-xylono/L-arabinono-1,4-lactonase